MILAGDIGGTKAHLALFHKEEKRTWIVDKKFKSSDYKDLQSIVNFFLQDHTENQVDYACFGVAGPVKNQKCRATNLPWVVDAHLIAKETKIPHVWLINDLEANAFGVHCLEEEELYTLNKGNVYPGNKALISAGTGLGEAGFFWDGKKIHPFACEGGHCTFAPENDLEIELLRYLKKQYDHVSFERVLSGPGLYHIYRFIIDSNLEKESEEVHRMMQEKDPPMVITEMGMKSACSACARALECFVSIYGSEAGNLALKMLAIGGVFIGGGIAPKILNEMREGNFMKRFITKGRFTSLLLGIPVKVVLNENTALLGAAYYARERKSNRRT